ncbi:tripartite tricarboxylate transporter substrate binding protein [Vineibacter terrae]|uniref:tripartite tricarboxylate transporter substrate binding protein n=1 Tax=Vineibacter terrae TaxID=2586908 RepID=UPI002E37770D|nr:tripartite tricarboxylate transporter substrate binding protein [Vineibacter terrae]HEX2886488.1 tripartite tricarboxylate transporter substrate binding protein [Vineibacter terrae]
MRALFGILLACLAPVLGASSALAQDSWPSRPVKIIVPFPAGGSTDIIAREVAQGLTAKFGQQFLVDNRPGAGGTVGTAAVAKSPGDGYTFLVTASHHTIVPSLYPQITYDPLKDLRGVSLLVTVPVVVVAHPSVPIKTVKDLIAYDKSHPGKLNYGSSGAGGVNHLSAELFNYLANTRLTHIAYKGTAPAMQDLIAGHVQIMFDAILTSLPHIRSGAIKPIALTGTRPSPLFPGLPTVADSGLPGYETSAWVAMFAPAGTPPEIITQVSDEARRVLSQPAFKERQQSQGVEIAASTPQELDDVVKAEIPKWSTLIKKVGVTAE